jgi:hypothetical protein
LVKSSNTAPKASLSTQNGRWLKYNQHQKKAPQGAFLPFCNGPVILAALNNSMPTGIFFKVNNPKGARHEQI